jgi:hypothetical protein
MGKLLDFGSQLAVTRHALHISQRALGERLGVRQQQIARWEASGYRTASLERANAVAQALGVDPWPDTTQAPLAAERPATYGAAPAYEDTVRPVRDLGEIAARIRAHGGRLRDDYGIGSVSVFGSFALGEQTPGSDVDLLIEFADKARAQGFRFMEAADYVEDVLGRKVDFIQPALLKERLRDRVLGEAIRVWAA